MTKSNFLKKISLAGLFLLVFTLPRALASIVLETNYLKYEIAGNLSRLAVETHPGTTIYSLWQPGSKDNSGTRKVHRRSLAGESHLFRQLRRV